MSFELEDILDFFIISEIEESNSGIYLVDVELLIFGIINVQVFVVENKIVNFMVEVREVKQNNLEEFFF